MKNHNQMASTNSQGPLSGVDWFKLTSNLYFVITRPLIEVAYGIRSSRIPLAECFLWGDFVGGIICLHLDQALFRNMGIPNWYPHKATIYYSYCAILMTSGFWFWGLFQSMLRTKLIKRLTQVFIEVGLKSPLGKLPSFIFDYPVDEFTRKMRLGRSCFSLEQFEKAKPALESSLQIYIDEMRESRENGSLDIIYSHSPMPTITHIENIETIPALSFVIGKTRAKQLTTTLQKVPHLMVAGQTGGGKSTFLRGLITTLYLNNSDYSFTLIDLKGGLEFQTFENLSRIKVIPSVKQAITNLQNLERTLKERMDLLKANDCKDIDAYRSLREEDRKDSPGSHRGKLGRHILVIDEAAEMFLAGSHAQAGDIQTARRVLSQIARQGRSVGVHLIIATQRPDAKALDPQVKANLTGVVCFQMLNDASSITVLGVGRATELPAIAGRAIWKCGSEMIEVQTPYLSTEEVDRLMEKHKSESPKTYLGDKDE
ncbi:MAG: DNA translocase FtsK [Bdellovibrio sp.]|nr:DNA translocase FtsK [Bdellovibrio sp.]